MYFLYYWSSTTTVRTWVFQLFGGIFGSRDIRLNLTSSVRKNDICPTDLRDIAFETNYTRYPFYTDGYLLDFTQAAVVGVFCDLSSFYLHVDSHNSHYDGEIEAIHLTLHHLSAHFSTPDKTVILSDSSSALQGLASNQYRQKSRKYQAAVSY
ncbi:hypothetical protein TNCT_469521 [Trichonephila clavata]|uniref:Uncharacterized protein n=1 Tax=Trichonephila clavata TaxID=2740835 RepID=A0A8X6KRX4_TRICU|nr:hypothetical protein TNCT_469521 [Trichonephila clavata]